MLWQIVILGNLISSSRVNVDKGTQTIKFKVPTVIKYVYKLLEVWGRVGHLDRTGKLYHLTFLSLF